MTRRTSMNVHLLKPGLVDDEVISIDSEEFHRLSPGKASRLSFSASLYIRKRDAKMPPWEKFLRPAFDGLPLSANATNSAVLIVRNDSDGFAFTFGHGRAMLEPSAYVRGFGLRLLLGLIDPEHIRSIDTKFIDHVTFHSSTQTNRNVRFEDFGANPDRDMLRAAVGFPTRAHEYYTKLAGSDSLLINPKVGFEQLGKLTEWLAKKHAQKKYKKRFEWIDRFKPVNDPEVIQSLDSVLLSRLRGEEVGDTQLAQPEPIDWASADVFTLRLSDREREVGPNVSIRDYYRALGRRGDLSVNDLKVAHRVLLRSDSGTRRNWPVYRCLFDEFELLSKKYVLDAGDYYEVDHSYEAKIRNMAAGVTQSSLRLPEYDDADETRYNQRVGDNDQNVILMDRRLATNYSGRSKVEVCDLFTTSKQFVHVKHRDTGSRGLAYLFSQAAISAECFLNDRAYRSEIVRRFPELSEETPSFPSVSVDMRPRSSDYEVVLAIIALDCRLQDLPFVALLNLYQRVSRLRELGFKVTWCNIPKRGAVRIVKKAEQKSGKKSAKLTADLKRTSTSSRTRKTDADK